MRKKKKVLFISHVLDGSGAPRSLLYLLRFFPEEARSHYLFYLLGLRRKELLPSFQELCEEARVITASSPQTLPGKALERLQSLPAIWRYLKQVVPDLVFINSAANSRALFLSRLAGYRTWVYVHEFDEGFVKLARLRRKAILLSERALVTNPLQITWLRKEVEFKGPVEILPNALPPLSPPPPPKDPAFLAFRKRYSFLLGMAGYISRLKGWDLFLEVIKGFLPYGEMGFVVVGDFVNPSEKMAFLKEVEALGLGERFYLTGLKEDALPYLGCLDCVAITSRSETFSRVALEAMACGVPVVSFRVGSIKAVFPQGYPYLVPPFEVEKFVRCVKEIKELKDRTPLEKMLKARARLFEAPRIAKRFARMLKEAFS